MAKKVKMVQCPHCGTLNPKKAKLCTNCGESLVPPIYKRKWFIAVIVVVVLALFATITGGSSSDSTDQSDKSDNTAKTEEVVNIEYTKYDVTELFDDLDKNAMKAESLHQDEYVEISGYLSNIDSDGKYISVGAEEKDYDYMFKSILCDFHGNNKDEQKAIVMEMNTNDKITVKGKITSIGEVLGYNIDIDEIIAG